MQKFKVRIKMKMFEIEVKALDKKAAEKEALAKLKLKKPETLIDTDQHGQKDISIYPVE